MARKVSIWYTISIYRPNSRIVLASGFPYAALAGYSYPPCPAKSRKEGAGGHIFRAGKFFCRKMTEW